MRKTFLKGLLFVGAIYAGTVQAASNNAVEIPYERVVLDNGLTVIIHEDHKAPIVAVSVWYKVGSKDEPEGKTGFAHLFEHLMFNGSENHKGEFFAPFDQVGATSMNGTTWFDRTNYFENVPTPALDMALWMESDRMGHLLGAIDQKTLDEQRGVVQNEKRQGDNQPYGKTEYRILEGLYPVGHPYRHSTIGSMEDLNAASLDDVKTWFKSYYGAANTVLVLAGDLTTEQGKTLAQKYFGDIASGPEVKRMTSWVPSRINDTIETMYDTVPQARIYKTWAVPGRTTQDGNLLNLAADILGGGKNSRLYQALVYKTGLASQVNVSIEEHQLSSQLTIQVTLKSAKDSLKVDQIIDEELTKFLAKNTSNDELTRAVTGINARVTRGLERIGGFGGKATALARGELYANDPSFYKTQLNWINSATQQQIHDVANRWLSQGKYQLTVLPFPSYKTSESMVDRSKGLPVVGQMPQLTFPQVEHGTLKNGIPVSLVKNSSIPVVNIAMQFDAGYAADSTGFKLGTAGYTLAMLDEGTKKMSSLEIASKAELLGAELETNSNLDMSSVELSALKSELKPSLDLFADIVLNPAFSNEEIERLRSRWLSGIQQEKAQPQALALRNLPPLLYGKDHAYGIPFTGSGTEASIQSLTRADLVKFYQTWIRPDNATLYVVGDVEMNEILSLLNKSFGQWKNPGTEIPKKNIAEINTAHPQLIIIDKPNAPQSLILGGQLAPPTGVKNNLEIVSMNEILGGSFSARVNMNLREDKHWAYGAYTFMQDARGQRPYFVYAPVQTDKTGVSLKELLKEINAIITDKPATSEELQRVINNNVNSLPGAYETSNAILNRLLSNQRFARSDDYVTQLSQRYSKLSLDEINQVAKKMLKADQITWMIVGDRKEIEKQLDGIDLGKIVYMDADGQVLN